MGLSLHRFSRVPGESWMVFSCLLGFGGCPNACDKSSGVLGNFWASLPLVGGMPVPLFRLRWRFCLNVLLVVLLSIFELIG